MTGYLNEYTPGLKGLTTQAGQSVLNLKLVPFWMGSSLAFPRLSRAHINRLIAFLPLGIDIVISFAVDSATVRRLS
jgi:hypothetical protein